MPVFFVDLWPISRFSLLKYPCSEISLYMPTLYAVQIFLQGKFLEEELF